MNTSLLVINEAASVSHIILEYSGNIKVKISEKDYRDYKERLSFDQLCSSMADIFVRFLDYYQKGLESRIVTELKSAR
jgi:maltose-binding protein MalE